jgi:hypothetical protein
MMKFYRERNCAWAQVQAVGAWLQIGSTIWGVYPDTWIKSSDGWGPIGLGIWKPVTQCGMRDAFDLSLFRLRIRYTTRGETHPGHYRWDVVGWKFRNARKSLRASA